eukprot:scaffold195744_cov37-Tisochrysis_lutea.AAC.4
MSSLFRFRSLGAPTLRSPYLLYICMKLPLALFALMPSNLASLWVKHNMALEGWIGMYNYVLIYALLGGARQTCGLRSASQKGKQAICKDACIDFFYW